ncbi:C2H2 zinc finger protein, partial [Scheffersomyces stipitis CBS 6054]
MSFRCSFLNCGKKFTRKDYLARHELNHTNEKPYKCEQCQFSFTRSDLLNKHFKSQSHRKRKQELFKSSEKTEGLDKPDQDFEDIESPSKKLRFSTRNEPSSQKQPLMTVTSSPIEDHIFTESNDLPPGSFNNYLWLFDDSLDVRDDNFVSKPLNHQIEPSLSSTSHIVEEESFREIDGQRRLAVLELLNIHEVSSLAPDRFSLFLDLYWSEFNPTFPIIHYATFNNNEADVYLLTAMICIGMAHSPLEAEYELSIVVTMQFRRLIFDAVGDDVVLRLPLLQSLLLHNFACKYYGDKLLYEMSQLFHGTNINFLRFTGFFDDLVEPNMSSSPSATYHQLETDWKKWIHYETCKRTAYFAFVCDSQHATLFKHQVLSAFSLQIDLPSTDAVWNASNPITFSEMYRLQPRGLSYQHKVVLNLQSGQTLSAPGPSMPSVKAEGNWPEFLWSLRSMMMPYKESQKEYSLDCYSQFSRSILLHGIISICWDMRWRGLFDLGIVSKKKLSDLSGKLLRAFYNWKGYLDLHISSANERALGKNVDSEPSVGLNDYGLSPAFWSNLSSYQLGLISLFADTASIVKYATELKNSRRAGVSRNKIHIESWARSPNGDQSIREAARFIRIISNAENEHIISIPHIPWTLFISCLVIWCYETNRDCLNGLTSRDHIELSYAKYYNPSVSYFDEQAVKHDTLEYISLAIDNEADDVETSGNFWKRQ